MSTRVTIVLDDDNSKKLRQIQANEIKFSNGSVSFSRVLNSVLEKGLKK